MVTFDYAVSEAVKLTDSDNPNSVADLIYDKICTLPRKVQLNLIERFITENDLTNDLIDINIAKQRITEPGMDYEEFRKSRKCS